MALLPLPKCIYFITPAHLNQISLLPYYQFWSTQPHASNNDNTPCRVSLFCSSSHIYEVGRSVCLRICLSVHKIQSYFITRHFFIKYLFVFFRCAIAPLWVALPFCLSVSLSVSLSRSSKKSQKMFDITSKHISFIIHVTRHSFIHSIISFIIISLYG